MNSKTLSAFLLILLVLSGETRAADQYLWLKEYQADNALGNRIAVPRGSERISVSRHSFADWLRHLPLKKGKPPVYLYNGQKKWSQAAHYAVVDIDVGDQDLQQCADAVIRLRAEYLYFRGNYASIHFNFTSGDDAAFSGWIEGYRPLVNGNKVTWRQSQKRDRSYRSFKKYLKTVFMYAGSYSLEKELRPVKNITEMHIGDVFIQGGFPGHAVLIIDMAVYQNADKKLFLLAQSYMPAQEVHILVNPSNRRLSPWYDMEFGEELRTPEWTFGREQLKRF